jgi:hypothetical protein
VSGRRRGQALVEFAIAFPLLLLAGLGGVQLALVAEAKIMVQLAAQQVARSLSVYAAEEALADFLPLGEEVAAFSLAGITPLPGPLTALADLPLAGHRARAKEARQRLRLSLRGESPGNRGRERVLELTYDFPLLVPLAGKCLARLAGGGADPLSPTLRLTGRSLTRFAASR